MRLIIAGSRSLRVTKEAIDKIDLHLARMLWEPDVVLCGMAKGADTAGKKWAEGKGIKVEEYPADWRTHGRGAGIVRNTQMAQLATHLLLIWDGKSRGSMHMKEIAEKYGLVVQVRRFWIKPRETKGYRENREEVLKR